MTITTPRDSDSEMRDVYEDVSSDQAEAKVLDATALDRIFECYLPKLALFAERRISKRLQGKLTPDSVAHSVVIDVCKGLRKGTIQYDDDAGFWRLLNTIVKRKISNRVRRLKSQKRNIDREVPDIGGCLAASLEPSPEEVALFDELMVQVLSKLEEAERQVLLLRLQNLKFQEIAYRRGVSERTVRRKMDLIKEKLKEFFPEQFENS